MRHFSNNLIFFDAEFTSLDPTKGEIISVGLIKLSGEELYLEVDHSTDVNPWVRDHVVPLLQGPQITRAAAAKKIIEFAGAGKPFLCSYVIEYDAPYLYKLLGVNDKAGNKSLPYHWIVVDFATMLFAAGMDPAKLSASNKKDFLHELGIDLAGYNEHHALDDARLLRDVYLRLFGS